MKGFTLFELMLVMSISALLLIAAIPSYHHFIFRNKTAALVNQLEWAIHMSRQQAIATHQELEFCGSSNRTECDGRWQEGQVLRVVSTKQILRIFSLVGAGERLWWQSSLGDNNTLKLAPTGFTEGQHGSFYYCSGDNQGRYGAQVIVMNSGRVRVETDTETMRKSCSS
jgi:prepilin-type N-terminal cleavage/methylation domain-containing protein